MNRIIIINKILLTQHDFESMYYYNEINLILYVAIDKQSTLNFND